jgi:hypothetical protein
MTLPPPPPPHEDATEPDTATAVPIEADFIPYINLINTLQKLKQ